MNKISTLLIVFLCAFYVEPCHAQDEDQSDAYQKLKTALKSGEITMNFFEATTKRGTTIDMDGELNIVVLRPETSAGHLEFYGETWVLNSGFGTGNIVFDDKIARRTEKYNDKKERVQLSFRVKGTADSYSCSLTLFASGSCSLGISSPKRDRISYRGNYVIK